MVRRGRRRSIQNSEFRIQKSFRAFTLIELLVSVGLTAIFLTMVATIFGQAGSAFSAARSGVAVHQNARVAFDIMLRDFSAAQMCSYENKEGYFALSWERDIEPASGGEYPVQAVTFTTLAQQPGAEALVKGISPQVALVRYTLRFSGGSATIDGDNPATTAVEDEYQALTFDLIKQVRFPQLAYRFCDMSAFPEPNASYKDEVLPDESVTTDVVAFNVYDMTFRVYYKGEWIEVLDHGLTTGGAAGNIEDDTRQWDSGPAINGDVQLLAGDAAPQSRTYSSLTGATQINVTANFSPSAAADCTYRIDDTTDSFSSPTWAQLPDRDAGAFSYADGNMYPMRVIENIGGAFSDFRMPYLVEVTLKMADPDSKAKKNFIFTQRFAIPTAFE